MKLIVPLVDTKWAISGILFQFWGRSPGHNLLAGVEKEVGWEPDGEPQDGRDAVRRNGGLRHHVPAGVPHGPPSRSIQHRRLLSLLRQQRRQPRHLLFHEPGTLRG